MHASGGVQRDNSKQILPDMGIQAFYLFLLNYSVTTT